MSVSVIIPTYDRPEMLNRLIESVNTSDYEGEIEVIVVDGLGTLTPNDVESGVDELINKDSDTSLAECRNAGMRAASKDYYLIIDDDNTVGSSCISTLVRSLNSSPTVGAVSPFMYYYKEPDRIWCGGVIRDYRLSTTKYIANGVKDIGQFEGEIFQVDDAPNAVMLDGDIVSSVGYHNSSLFPIEYEHCELMERIQSEGYDIRAIADAKVYHDIPINEPPRFNDSERMYFRARNRILFQYMFSERHEWWMFAMLLPVLTSVYIYKFFKYSDLPTVVSKSYLAGTSDAIKYILMP